MALRSVYRFANVGSLGDKAGHDKHYNPILNSWSRNFCCFRCAASKVFDHLNYLDFSWHAGWRRTLITNDMLMSSLAEDEIHPLMRDKGTQTPLVCKLLTAPKSATVLRSR